MSGKNAKLIKRFVKVAKVSDYTIFRMSEEDILDGAEKNLKKKFKDTQWQNKEKVLKFMKFVAH